MFRNNRSFVQRTDGKWNALNAKGQFLSDNMWFDKIDYLLAQHTYILYVGADAYVLKNNSILQKIGK